MSLDENAKLLGDFKNSVFKLNGLFMQESEGNLENSKLTVSRARVLGVLLRAGKPLTIPQIANEMGQTRQGLGRLVNLMVADGYLVLQDNPIHQRSKLVSPTDKAKAEYEIARHQYRDTVQNWPYPVSVAELHATREVVERLNRFLERYLAESPTDR